MQPNGNVIVDTICRTAKLGTTITGATENGDVTVIEAEPVEPINECPTCGQPGVFRDQAADDMVKKYESEKYRIQPSERMRKMLEHYLAEHRRAVVAIVERHRGDERAVLSFSRVSDLPEGLPDWVRAEESVKRRAAAVREAAVLLEAEGVAVDYTYMPEETE